MNDINGQYRIIGYVDDLEEAERRCKSHNISDSIINEIDEIHDELVEMQPFLTTSEDNDKLKEALEGPIGDLILASGEGKKEKVEDLIKIISEKVKELKRDLE